MLTIILRAIIVVLLAAIVYAHRRGVDPVEVLRQAWADLVRWYAQWRAGKRGG